MPEGEKPWNPGFDGNAHYVVNQKTFQARHVARSQQQPTLLFFGGGAQNQIQHQQSSVKDPVSSCFTGWERGTRGFR